MKAFAAIIAVQTCFVAVVTLRIDVLSSAAVHVGLPTSPSVGASLGPFGMTDHARSSALPSCLFVMSTSAANEEHILRQFNTCRDDRTVGLWINICDKGSNNNNNNYYNYNNNNGSTSILRSETPGLKPTLWEQVAPQHTSAYEHLYFLDDDMLFDRNVFAFDQLRWLVQRVDAVISSPKTTRNSVPESERRAAAATSSDGGGGVTAGRTSTKKPSIRGGGSVLRTNTTMAQQRRRRLASQNGGGGGGWRLNPLGLCKEETTADQLAAKVKVVEIGSFMIKTKAWHFFRENIFVPSSASDCGPDCVWCRVFEKEGTRFGAVPCLRTLHVGITHDILDTAGTMICPFVRCLLPTAMSLMTDPSEECASLAASSFAALVRVSPLVEKRRDVNPGNADPSELERDSNKVIDHLIHGEPLPPLSLPSSIQACMDKSQTTLRGYQKEGISWLHFLQSVNLNGALCDDMGVGKSLQALVGIALAHSNAVGNVDGALKSLVVCPSTVVGHWMKEAEKYFPLVEHIFKPLMYTGSAKARKAMLEEKFKECNLVVTSYSVLRNDIDALSSISWVYCVLDEGHLLKNPGSATARASRLIKSRHKLILSGTPVQNHVNELWAVFDFLMPNFLGSEAVFTKSFAKPIINGQSSGASPSAIGTSINKLKLLHQTVLPFILRREKQDVMKELPPKVMSDIPCVLSSVQATMYQQFIESSEAKHALAALQRSIEAAHQNGGGGSNSGVDIDQEQSMGRDVLKSLLYLRLLCTHPILVVKRAEDGNDGEDDEREDIAEQLSRLDSSGKLMALKDLLQSASICSDGLTAADNDQSTLYAKRVIPDYTDLSSGDFTQSNEDLSDDLNGEEGSSTMAGKDQLTSKCLIFAQFTQSLDIVEEYLFAPHMPSLRYLRIDGQVPLEERTKRVDRFNSDESIQVMLLTTRVGGLGLNLTGADTVVFLESDWNPFSDLQAMDRAHRIGQTKTVNVYRLICSDTIEEKIMRLQSIKMEMSKAIVNSDNSTMYSMGTDRLLDLFTFEDRQVNNGNGRKTTEASKAEGANILDVVSSQEDEYLSLSTERFLRDLLPQKG